MLMKLGTVDKRVRMIQSQVSPDFLDPTHEWRRMFAEMWGTFLLVLVAVGSGAVPSKKELDDRYYCAADDQIPIVINELKLDSGFKDHVV